LDTSGLYIWPSGSSGKSIRLSSMKTTCVLFTDQSQDRREHSVVHDNVWLTEFKITSVHSACHEANLMYYLSSVSSVTIPLQVSGLEVAHYQEVIMYIYNKWYMYVLFHCHQAWLGWDHPNQARWQSTKTYNMYHLLYIHIVTSWWWATSKPKTCRGRATE
jgi:hypothetical protein